MNWRQRIERKPEVMCGKPVIKGSRITVELILERLGDGWTEDQLLKSFPHLQRNDLQAAFAFAAAALADDEVVLLADERT